MSNSNGHLPHLEPPPGDDEPDDDAPLDDVEAAAAAALADEALDESLDERVTAVIDDLGDVERARRGEAIEYLAGGRLFAVLSAARLEAALDPAVARAALRTPDASPSPRGPGWILFAPAATDRFALDRAEAWIRSAHRRIAS